MTAHGGPIEIVLTGGPCSGKTTSLRYLVEHLSARGWRVLVVPEAATMLITGGLHDIGTLAVSDRPAYLRVQENLVLLQHDLAERFRSLADDIPEPADEPAHPGFNENATKTVVLHDRAILDNRAYMSAAEFNAVVTASLDKRPSEVAAQYDAVLHLVTAADGSPEHYTTANNEARTETIEQAIALDRAVQAAWLGHPHLTVIGNEHGTFDKKLTRILATVLNILGEPEPVEIERKWLLSRAPDPATLGAAVAVDIEQIYLPAGLDGTERRIRARTHDGHTTYFYTEKKHTLSMTGRVENESIITAETYRLMASMRAPGTQVLRKQRHCFVHDGQHFELDHLTAPNDVWLLEAELVTADDTVRLPAFLPIDREVTDDLDWRNNALAARPVPDVANA